MLVRLANNWSAPDGTFYRKGTIEWNGKETLLPSSAVILSPDGTLPSKGPKTLPGFGGKPFHEQLLDLIPGAAPTHQTDTTVDNAPVSVKTPEELEEERKRAEDADKVRAEEAEKKANEHLADDRAATETGVEAAKKVEELAKPAQDPIAAALDLNLTPKAKK